MVEEAKRGAVGGKQISEEQELITYDDIRAILDSTLMLKQHPIPEYMVGALYVIDGKTQAIETIMAQLERRSKLFKGYTKPQKEEKDA